MVRYVLAAALAVAGAGTVQAAECTPSLYGRWEDAMREAAQLHREVIRLRLKEPDLNTKCRFVRSVAEITKAGREYFSACDPINEARINVVLQQASDTLSKLDPPDCSKSLTAGKRK
jgi:hypothetical protein